MLWVILSILAALLWTVANVIDKFVLSHELRDSILATIVYGISTFLLFSIVSFIFGNVFLPVEVIIFALMSGMAYTVAILFYYFALQKEEVSRSVSVLSTTPIFVVFFAFFFLKEKFSFLTYLGVFLIVLGAFLISIKKSTRKLGLSMTFLTALSAALFFAIRNLLLKSASIGASIWSLLFWIGLGSGIASLFLFFLHHAHIRKKLKSGVKHIVIVGFLSAIAFFLFSLAVSMGSVSLVSALVETKPIFVFLLTLFLSIFHPNIIKEKITKAIIIQKAVAIAVIIIGAILII